MLEKNIDGNMNKFGLSYLPVLFLNIQNMTSSKDYQNTALSCKSVIKTEHIKM